MVAAAASDHSGAMTQHSETSRGDHPSADTGPRVTRDDVKDVGRLRRTTNDRQIAGVASGLARHLDIDPIIVRVGLVVAVLFGGAGLLLYAAAWVLVPEEGSQGQPLGLDERSRVFALMGAGVLAVLAAIGDWAGAFWFPWPFAVLALVVLWFVSRGSSGTTPYDGVEQQAWPESQSVDPAVYARPPRPGNPRRRGPVLFWFTLALIALAEGLLGVVDLAGADVVPSAYPALALAVTTAMLLLGSFWGRAGGLVLIGIVAALATVLTSLSGNMSDDIRVHTPTTAVAVQDAYDLGAGEMLVDLSQVEDPDNLDGRDISIDVVAGRVEVIVPEGVDVSVTTNVLGGEVRVFDQRQDGGDVKLSGFVDGGPEAPDLAIDVEAVFGEILVRTP